MRSGWDSYAGAIADALKPANPYDKDMSEWRAWERNKAFRLVKLLRAYRPLTDDDFDALADLFEMMLRGRGRERDEDVHDAARLAETIMMAIRKGGKASAEAPTEAITIACAQLAREGRPVSEERMRDLLSRPRSRRKSPI
jgi:hypothetical protein